jgi:hypothetical protein
LETRTRSQFRERWTSRGSVSTRVSVAIVASFVIAPTTGSNTSATNALPKCRASAISCAAVGASPAMSLAAVWRD